MPSSLPYLPAAPTYTQLQVGCEIGKTGQLPRYKSSAFRGLLGQAIWDYDLANGIAPDLLSGKEPESQKSLYHSLFKPSAPADHPHARKYENVPAPYLLTIHERRSLLYRGDRLYVTLTLIGRAANRLPELISVLEGHLDSGLGPDRIPLHMISLRFVPPQEPLPVADAYRLILQSPMHLSQRKQLCSPANLPVLVHRVAERLNVLQHFHSENSCELITDFEDWKALAATVSVENEQLNTLITRRDSRGNKSIRLPCYTGSLELHQVPPPLAKLLHQGIPFHVGKGSTWGMGRYSLEGIP